VAVKHGRNPPGLRHHLSDSNRLGDRHQHPKQVTRHNTVAKQPVRGVARVSNRPAPEPLTSPPRRSNTVLSRVIDTSPTRFHRHHFNLFGTKADRVEAVKPGRQPAATTSPTAPTGKYRSGDRHQHGTTVTATVASRHQPGETRLGRSTPARANPAIRHQTAATNNRLGDRTNPGTKTPSPPPSRSGQDRKRSWPSNPAGTRALNVNQPPGSGSQHQRHHPVSVDRPPQQHGHPPPSRSASGRREVAHQTRAGTAPRHQHRRQHRV